MRKFLRICPPGKRFDKLYWLPILALAAGGCGFGRDDSGVFCRDNCKDPKQKRDIFCNCFTPDEKPPSGGSFNGLVYLERKGQCIPSTSSPQVWLVNGTNKRRTVTWRHEYWEWDRKIWEKEGSATLSPWAREYLGCEGTLQYDDRFTILSSDVAALNAEPPFGEISREAALFGSPGSGDTYQITLVAFQVADSAPSCQVLCPDLATTARCTTTSLPPENQAGLRVLQTAITEIGIKNGLIEANDLGSWFGVKEDPCQRGPTAFVGGKFLNVGGPCSVRAQLSKSLFAELTVPMVVAGDVQAGELKLNATFSGAFDSRPQIHFLRSDGSPNYLDKDFGGEILAVEADGAVVFFRVASNRCIGARF